MNFVRIVLGAATVFLGGMFLCWSERYSKKHPEHETGRAASIVAEWTIIPGTAVLIAGINAAYSDKWLAITLVIWIMAAGIDLLCCYGSCDPEKDSSGPMDDIKAERS